MQKISKDESPGTFRTLLLELVNSNVSAILIGETHGISPVTAALVANLDILKNSKRKIVIISEGLLKSANPMLKQGYRNKDLSNNSLFSLLKSDAMMSTDTFELCKVMIESGIEIYGTEVVDLNHVHYGEILNYAVSPRRLTETNPAFAEVIQSFINDNSLVIFIGGASHNISLVDSDNNFVDLGISGRIKNSVTVHLRRSDGTTFAKNSEFVGRETLFRGRYDFGIKTNVMDIYLERFASCVGLEEKKQVLAFYINDKIEFYIRYKNMHSRKNTLTLNDDPVLKAFNNSTNSNFSFKRVRALIDNIVQQSETIPSLYSNLLSFFFHSKPYTKDVLLAEIDQDLSDEAPNLYRAISL